MIASVRNRRVVNAVRLKKRAIRERDAAFLIEGAQAVGEALASAAPVREVFVVPRAEERDAELRAAAARRGVPFLEVSDDVMARLTSTVTPQGVVAVGGFVDVALDALPDDARTVAVLAEVRDPGNAGTILRSADASGADAVVFTSSSVDVYNEKTVRASAGSIFHVPVVREVELEEAAAALRDRGFRILAADARGEASVSDVDLGQRSAFVFGNEARGLPAAAAGLADATVRVPIAGRAESLNLAAAATVVLFEAARRREAGVSLASIVAGAAHDIRSPLAALKGFTSTLISRWDRLDDDQRRMMIEAIAHDALRMQLLISQLVDAARLSSGTLTLNASRVNMLELATRTAEQLAREGQLEVVVDGSPWEVFADGDRLRTILAALVESAQWWGQEGPVRITVSGPVVSVSRAGGSLDVEEAAAIFSPRTPGSGGGSTVRLYAAKGLAAAHGAELRARADDGVRFELEMPQPPAGE